jgi:hypothetical protein
MNKITAFLFAAAVAAVSIEAPAAGKAKVKDAPVDPRASTIQAAEDAVRASLRDPDSARFGNVWFIERSGAVCGGINAKNAYGGYTGENRFVVKDGAVVIDSVDENEHGDLVIAFGKHCFDEDMNAKAIAAARAESGR